MRRMGAASIRIEKASPTFPAGTTVGAYDSLKLAGGTADNALSGSPAASAAVQSDGSLTLTGLEYSRRYYAAALVGGVQQTMSFTTPRDPYEDGPGATAIIQAAREGAKIDAPGAVAAAANTFLEKQTFTDEVVHTGTLVSLFSGGANKRIPFSANPRVWGPDAVADTVGGTNVGGFVLAPTIDGDFAGIEGADAGFGWGFNVFAIAGSNLDNFTSLTGTLAELALTHEAAEIDTVTGFQADLSFFGAGERGSASVAQTARISAPRRKNGATSGSFLTAYCLFVENIDAVNEAQAGTIIGGAYSLFVEGGVSRFGGRVDVKNQIAAYGTDGMTLDGDTNGGAHVVLGAGLGHGSGEIVLQIGQAFDSSRVSVRDGSGTEVAAIDKQGALHTKAHLVPADNSLSPGEAAIWFDQTNGSAKLMVKARQADGQVRTGSVTLS